MQVADFAPSFPVSIADARLRMTPPVFLGHSPAARRVQQLIHRATRSHQPMLLVGQRGTGKETIARIVHHFAGGEIPNLEVLDTQSSGTLVSLGAFTYINRLEALHLEEQARLPSLSGLGRVIIGTELRPESEEGLRQLHPDTVRWASSLRIDVPSLAERIEDLEMLALEFIRRRPSRRPVGGLSDAALDCLRAHRWPGNLDELEEVIAQAMREGSSDQLELRDLPVRLRVRHTPAHRVESPERQLCLEEVEKQAIRRALAYTHGNKRKAARLLRIGKTTLYRKIEQYGLA